MDGRITSLEGAIVRIKIKQGIDGYMQCENTCGAYSVYNFMIKIGKWGRLDCEETIRLLANTIIEVALNRDDPFNKGANPILMAQHITKHQDQYKVLLYGPRDLISILRGREEIQVTQGGESYDIDSLESVDYFIGIFGKSKADKANLATILSGGTAAAELHYMLCYKEDDKIICCDSNREDSFKGTSSIGKSGYEFLNIGILLQKKKGIGDCLKLCVNYLPMVE